MLKSKILKIYCRLLKQLPVNIEHIFVAFCLSAFVILNNKRIFYCYLSIKFAEKNNQNLFTFSCNVCPLHSQASQNTDITQIIRRTTSYIRSFFEWKNCLFYLITRDEKHESIRLIIIDASLQCAYYLTDIHKR